MGLALLILQKDQNTVLSFDSKLVFSEFFLVVDILVCYPRDHLRANRQ